MPTDSIAGDFAKRDYSSTAELFAVQQHGRKRNLFYRRFETAAEAMRFAIESMPADASYLVLETEHSRLDAKAIPWTELRFGRIAGKTFTVERPGPRGADRWSAALESIPFPHFLIALLSVAPPDPAA